MNDNLHIRFANKEELVYVNQLRKQINDLHISGRPEHFKSGFHDVSEQLYKMWDSDNYDIVIAELNKQICGYACVHRVNKAETPYTKPMQIYHIEEFCVDKPFRRQGVASNLISFLKHDAKSKGFNRIDLNMWEFNQDALYFYGEVGFQTYRRHMELII